MLDKLTARYLPVINYFCEQHPDFILVGGTALALQKSNRASIDFDLFTMGDFDAETLRDDLWRAHHEIADGILKTPELRLIGAQPDQMHFAVGKKGLKITLLKFPHKIESKKKYEQIPLATLESIFAMKLLALFSRVDYKDFYDIATLLDEFSLSEGVKFFQKMIAAKPIDPKIVLGKLAGVSLLDKGVEKSLRGAKMSRKKIVEKIEQALKELV
ncbi:MAG: nucleotidyl transferase AbiEii/AbiGii toxin family protein [Patescibacteria group bacterium]